MDEGSLGSESFATAPSFQAPRKKSGKRIIVILIFIILLMIGGYFVSSSLFGSNNSTTNEGPTSTPEEVTPTEEPTPTPEESPTPEASETPAAKPTSNPIDKTSGIDRSKFSVQVQNGSGVAGVGSKGSDFIKSLGYKVASVGNADNFNYENVTILVKSGSSNFLSLLKSDIGKQYTVGSSSATLSASSSADALIIIGK